MSRQGSELLYKVEKTLEANGVHVDRKFLRKGGKDEIVVLTEEEAVDCLVIGSRGLGMIKR